MARVAHVYALLFLNKERCSVLACAGARRRFLTASTLSAVVVDVRRRSVPVSPALFTPVGREHVPIQKLEQPGRRSPHDGPWQKRYQRAATDSWRHLRAVRGAGQMQCCLGRGGSQSHLLSACDATSCRARCLTVEFVLPVPRAAETDAPRRAVQRSRPDLQEAAKALLLQQRRAWPHRCKQDIKRDDARRHDLRGSARRQRARRRR